MMSEAAYVLLYGLFAALSPTVLLATLAVLGGGGRLNGLVFLVAFAIGQTLTFLAAFLIGSAVTFGDGTAGTVVSVLEIAGGIALVAIAWQRRSVPPGERIGPPASAAFFARLSHVKPAISFGVGMPLGIGLKRLVITFLAAASIASAGLDRASEIALGVEYVVVATVVVWCPVLIYLVLGARTDGMMDSVQAWITGNERRLLVGTAYVLGVFLTLDGIGQLLV